MYQQRLGGAEEAKHSQPPAPLQLPSARPPHAAWKLRPSASPPAPHQRLVAGEVGSLSSNGARTVATSSKPRIAPSRAAVQGPRELMTKRDSNVRDADKIVTLIWRREDV